MLFLGRDDHDHALAFEARHLFDLAHFDAHLRELQQDKFPLVLVDDGAALEEDVHFDLGPLLEEFDRMIQLEVEVMVIGVGSEADLLDDDLGRFRLDLLLLLLEFVQEFLVIDHLANRGVGGGTDLHEVQPLRLRDAECFTDVINTGLDVLPNHADDRRLDPLVDVVGFLFPDRPRESPGAAELCRYWCTSYV